MNDLSTGSSDMYAGDYMFLCYLAKYSSEHHGLSAKSKALTTQSSGGSLSSNVLTVTSKPSDAIIDLTKYSSIVKKVDASKLSSGVIIVDNTSANSLKGGKGADTISANTRNDTVYVVAGNDIFVHNHGNDFISGSNVVFNFMKTSVTVKGGKGKAITIVDDDGKVQQFVGLK